MEIRKTGIARHAALAGLVLAAVLGCGGKAHYSVPFVTQYSPGQGPVGSTVVLTGSSFNDIGSVSFGGAPAVFQVPGSTQIIATVPDQAITGNITVENTAGLGRTPGSFLVVPSITSMSPTSGPAGTVVIVTGSGFYGTTSVAIGGETPGAAGSSTFTYHTPNTITVVVGANATTGPLSLAASGLPAVTSPAAFTVN